MSRRRRMCDEAFRIPKIVRDIRNLKGIPELEYFIFTAVQFERYDRPAVAHLFLSQGVVGMGGEAWVENLENIRMIVQEYRYLMVISGMLFHAKIKCLQTLQ